MSLLSQQFTCQKERKKGNKTFGFRDSSDVSGDDGGLVTTGHHSVVSHSGGGFAELPCFI